MPCFFPRVWRWITIWMSLPASWWIGAGTKDGTTRLRNGNSRLRFHHMTAFRIAAVLTTIIVSFFVSWCFILHQDYLFSSSFQPPSWQQQQQQQQQYTLRGGQEHNASHLRPVLNSPYLLSSKQAPLSAADLLYTKQIGGGELEFVHIPKTGGSSIEYAASLANVTWGICHWEKRPFAGPRCQSPDWLMFRKLIQKKWEFWHAPPRMFSPEDSPYQNKTLFAVVRNPYERFISEFYCPYSGLNPATKKLYKGELPYEDPMSPRNVKQRTKGEKKQLETPYSLNSFLMHRLARKKPANSHLIPQSDFIYDEHGNQVVAHVLKHEDMNVQFTNLMLQYQLPVYLDNVTVNQRSKTNKTRRMSVNDLFPETIQRINEVARQDFLNFGYEMKDPADFAPARAPMEWSDVGRAYYINLAKNVKRRESVENWLDDQPTIPHFRIDASLGSENGTDCVEEKQDSKRCRGITGLAYTVTGIIRNQNTSGLTLVFEDDYVLGKNKSLQDVVTRTLRLVPPDWDVIRWDCWGYIPSSFGWVGKNVFKTDHQRPCPDTNITSCGCKFCGGTHAMMWRDSSLEKLERVWMQRPINDIDQRLTTDKLNSYCVMIAAGGISYPDGEESDIPKNKNKNK